MEYNILGMIGTKAQFLNLFYGSIAILLFLGIASFIVDRTSR